MFAKELIRRYRGRKAANPFEMLALLRQDRRPIEDYITQFEILAAQIGDMPENQALSYFLSGLRSDIRKHFGIHEPRTIMRAMALAPHIEEALVSNSLDPYTAGSNIGPKAE